MAVRMMLRPVEKMPERLGLYGGPGVGKTLGALSIIAAGLGPGETAWVVDTDNSYARFEQRFEGVLTAREWWTGGGDVRVMDGMERVGDWETQGGNVVVLQPSTWPEFRACMARVWAEAKRGDWVLVDSLTWPWQWIMYWYIEQVHGNGLPQFLMDYRVQQLKDGKGDVTGAGATLVEYNVVNKWWVEAFAGPFVNARCHVVVIAEAKEVRTDAFGGDKADIRKLYGKQGMKPVTQNRVGHNCQTLLYLEQEPTVKDSWLVSTVKDRERAVRLGRVKVGYAGLGGEEAEAPGLDKVYLRDVAGWTMRKVEV